MLTLNFNFGDTDKDIQQKGFNEVYYFDRSHRVLQLILTSRSMHFISCKSFWQDETNAIVSEILIIWNTGLWNWVSSCLLWNIFSLHSISYLACVGNALDVFGEWSYANLKSYCICKFRETLRYFSRMAKNFTQWMWLQYFSVKIYGFFYSEEHKGNLIFVL